METGMFEFNTPLVKTALVSEDGTAFFTNAITGRPPIVSVDAKKLSPEAQPHSSADFIASLTLLLSWYSPSLPVKKNEFTEFFGSV